MNLLFMFINAELRESEQMNLAIQQTELLRTPSKLLVIIFLNDNGVPSWSKPIPKM